MIAKAKQTTEWKRSWTRLLGAVRKCRDACAAGKVSAVAPLLRSPFVRGPLQKMLLWWAETRDQDSTRWETLLRKLDGLEWWLTRNLSNNNNIQLKLNNNNNNIVDKTVEELKAMADDSCFSLRKRRKVTKLLEKNKKKKKKKKSERLAGHPDRMLSRKMQRVPVCVCVCVCVCVRRIAARTAWAHNDGVSWL